MRPHLLTASLIGVAALLYFAPSSSAPQHRAFLTQASEPAQLMETDTVKAPYAYRRLCQEAPEFCAGRATAPTLQPIETALRTRFGSGALKPVLIDLTRERLEQLDQVNRTVNAAIQPRADHGGDNWRPNSAFGDCEEYVLLKRELLLRLGWPRTALRITVVRDGPGYHAVLVVRTNRGEFVLDNLVTHITRVEDSPYEFVVGQSLNQPGAWVRVHREG